MLHIILAAFLQFGGYQGTEETECFAVKKAPQTWIVTMRDGADKWGRDSYTNVALRRCKDGKSGGINALYKVPHAQARTVKLKIRATGRYYWSVVAGAESWEMHRN